MAQTKPLHILEAASPVPVSITESEFAIILSELSDVLCQINMGETLIGHHERYGAITLVRDGSRCVALVDTAYHDKFVAEQAFLLQGTTAKVAGRA